MNHFALYLEHCKSVIPRLKKIWGKEKKKGKSSTCYNIGEPQGHYSDWNKNKPITKRQIV